MKIVLLLFIATVLISRSTGTPVPDPQNPPPNVFGNNFFGGVGTVQQCGASGACQTHPGIPPPVIHGQTHNNFNKEVNTVQQCGVTGSCGKKKRSATDESILMNVLTA